ncbi:MAG TPA: hypothetical protein GX509_06620 [Firmicutes bacterium]|nr:hypothetical protein [Bacillota bacterium]
MNSVDGFFDEAGQVYGIDESLIALAKKAVGDTGHAWDEVELTCRHNFLKVMKAYQKVGVGDHHFAGTTGYGYGDLGREALERVFADAFGAERAMVRSQISSGTQAVALGLAALLLPGDELLLSTGAPYDTLQKVIGRSPGDAGSLMEMGINVKQVDLLPDGSPDLDAIGENINSCTKVVFVQRSKGYSWRPALSVDEIGRIVGIVRQANSRAKVLVDNCYGEFVERDEPTAKGADLICGSLIKNPGGGIAPCGGYIAGKDECMERVAMKFTAPGQGDEIGPTLGLSRLFLQGFFLAPFMVCQALKGAIFASGLFRLLGFDTIPGPNDHKGDIVLGILFGNRERLVSFCRGIQESSPVNAQVLPEPAPMPGYDHEVLMGGGTFVQGASSELTVDAPLREPYAGYLQGGFAWEQVALGVLRAIDRMWRQGLVD